MKKLALLCALMLMFLTGCSHLPAIDSQNNTSEPTQTENNSDTSDSATESSDPADPSSESSAAYYDGRIGDTLSTVFFDFTVDSVSLAPDIPASDGMMTIDLVITIKNTFGSELPMFYNDFQMQYGDGDQDFCYSIIDDTLPLNMPESYTLKRAETGTYHMYFEVPEEATEFALAYLEIWDDGSTGDTFFIYFERE